MQITSGLLPKGRGGDPRQSKIFGTLFVHQQGGGGGDQIQKFWGTFCAPQILEFWAEKGGGVDQIQKKLGTFYPDFGEI